MTSLLLVNKRYPSSDFEYSLNTKSVFQVASLRNTIRLLRDELWQVKMHQTSNELSKLTIPSKETKSNEIADIYKSSTLLLNVCSSIAK